MRPARLRACIAAELRRIADRLDRAGAPKITHVSFTFEEGVGIVFRDDARGCRVAYLGDAEYERAHNEAGSVSPMRRSTVWLPGRLWARH